MAEKEYIEREAACAEIKRFAGYIDNDMILRLQIAVQKLHAADVVEVRHGRWRDDADEIDKRFHRHDFFCKKCNTRADYFIGGEGNWWSDYAPDYCPHCGAKNGGVNDAAD